MFTHNNTYIQPSNTVNTVRHHISSCCYLFNESMTVTLLCMLIHIHLISNECEWKKNCNRFKISLMHRCTNIAPKQWWLCQAHYSGLNKKCCVVVWFIPSFWRWHSHAHNPRPGLTSSHLVNHHLYNRKHHTFVHIMASAQFYTNFIFSVRRWLSILMSSCCFT